MSTAVRRRRWTRRDYERVVDVCGFAPDDRVELLDGEIWEMSPHGARHGAVVSAVHAALFRAFGAGHDVRCQLPLALDDRSEPEPDVVVLRGEAFDCLDAHPTGALLVVEVSDSSLVFDRGRKLAAYARNGVPEYWIVDLQANRLEVCRDPSADGYGSRRLLARRDAVTPLHAPGAEIPLAQVLPPA